MQKVCHTQTASFGSVQRIASCAAMKKAPRSYHDGAEASKKNAWRIQKN